MDVLIYLSGLLLIGISCQVQCITLDTYLEWSTVEFEYGSKIQEERDIKSGKYIPGNIVISSAEVYKGKNDSAIFITTPDFIPGTPFTLSTVSSNNGSGGPLLKPFPNAKAHKVSGDCNSITNVWSAKLDKYDRLWVVDNGKINTMRQVKTICPPQILIYDLHDNNKLIKRYKVPGLNSKAILADAEFEYLDDNDKDDMVAYFFDESSSSVIVYNYKKGSSFIVDHPYMNPSPYLRIDNKFYKMFGIDGMAISPPDKEGQKTMYFHSLSSGRQAAVPTDILRDPKKNTFTDYRSNYKILDDRGFHSSVELVKKNGTMIFVNLEESALMTWDSGTSYKTQNFKTLTQDDKLQFPGSLQIVNENMWDYIYVTSTNLLRIASTTPEKNVINYRILKAKL